MPLAFITQLRLVLVDNVNLLMWLCRISHVDIYERILPINHVLMITVLKFFCVLQCIYQKFKKNVVVFP